MDGPLWDASFGKNTHLSLWAQKMPLELWGPLALEDTWSSCDLRHSMAVETRMYFGELLRGQAGTQILKHTQELIRDAQSE